MRHEKYRLSIKIGLLELGVPEHLRRRMTPKNVSGIACDFFDVSQAPGTLYARYREGRLSLPTHALLRLESQRRQKLPRWTADINYLRLYLYSLISGQLN